MRTIPSFILLFLFLIPSVFSMVQSPQVFYTGKCIDQNQTDASEIVYSNETIGIDRFSDNVKLNGESVKKIDCSRFEEYEFTAPDIRTKGISLGINPTFYLGFIIIQILILSQIFSNIRSSNKSTEIFGSITVLSSLTTSIIVIFQIYTYRNHLDLFNHKTALIISLILSSFLAAAILFYNKIREKQDILYTIKLLIITNLVVYSFFIFLELTTGLWIA